MNVKKILSIIIFILLFSSCAYCDFGGYSGNSDHGSDRGGGSESNSGRSGSEGRSSSKHERRREREITRNKFLNNISGDTSAILNERDKKTDWGGIIFIGCAVSVFAFLITRSNKRKRKNNFVLNDEDNLKPISEYCALNPDFDPQKIITWANSLYIKMQETWTAGNIEPVRENLTPEFFNIVNKRLSALNAKNQTDYTDDITVLDTNIRGWQQFKDNEYLFLRLHARIKSYIIENNTGRLISGSKTREKFMLYEWVLMRSKLNWRICNIKSISQRTI